jgi:hypothetical protein
MSNEVGRFIELDNLIRKIAHLLIDVENADQNVAESAKKICKLLYYTESSPLLQPEKGRKIEGNPAPVFDTITDAKEYIMNRRVLLVPKVPAEEERGAFIVVIIDDFTLSPDGLFKPNVIKFDILVHYDNWLLTNSLRPFLIMQQIDNIFNNRKLSVGKVEFAGGKGIVLTEKMLGYTLVYSDVNLN